MDDLPTEMRSNIFSYLTDPVDIIEISRTNSSMRKALKFGLTKLTTTEEILYLDGNWLTDYPFLTDVDDSIIFQANDITDLKIPENLRKFNLSLNYTPNVTQNIKSILDQVFDNLSAYTIRFIIHHDVSDYVVIIIDRGVYNLYLDHEKDEKLVIFMRNYSSNLTEYSIIYPADYPNKMFPEFVKDVSNELGVNIYLPTYNQYGYIDSGLIKVILRRYLSIKKLIIKSHPSAGMIVKSDYLLKKYASQLLLDSSEFITVYKYTMSSKGYIPGRDYTKFLTSWITEYAHWFLTNPTINELCRIDYENVINLLNPL